MKLAMVGVTGFVGQRLLVKVLAAGHSVRALARSPEKLGALGSRIGVVRGELSDPTAVQALVEGTEAVISLVGPPRKHDSAQHAQGTRHLVEAMQRGRVKRLFSGLCSRITGGGHSTLHGVLGNNDIAGLRPPIHFVYAAPHACCFLPRTGAARPARRAARDCARWLRRCGTWLGLLPG